MKIEKAKYFSENMEEVARRDRIFLNNPVVYHALGIAPLVVVDTSAGNAWMLFVTVLLMLTPIRVVSNLLTRRWGERFRPLFVVATAALWYVPVWFLLNGIFGQSLLTLGLYLPMFVCEPLVIQRFEHVPDKDAVSTAHKGIQFTLGYGLILLVLGLLRELLGAGTLFGLRVLPVLLFPIALMPQGGFLLLGLLLAVWVGCVNRFKKVVAQEARYEL